MRRLFAVIAICLANVVAPALAADGAQSRAIGYSKDWKYFAFEQYGIQDGSGFPFWEIYMLDLAADSWVRGTPVRILIDDEEGRLTTARDQAYAAARPLLDKLAINEPADLLAANPGTEDVPDRTVVRFDAYYNSAGPYARPEDRGAYEISVKTITVPSVQNCPDPDIELFGMELTLRNRRTGKAVTLARDSAIPSSRFCPSAYDIEAIHAPASYGTEARNVAIIGVFSRGFEGLDRRFIAVPFNMAD